MRPTEAPPTTADIAAAFKILCPQCASPADWPCANGTPYTCPERIAMAMAQKWTAAELTLIAEMAGGFAALFENVEHGCRNHTLEVVRAIQRKAAQLAFQETCKP